ncbi:MAG: cytochrome c [Gemmataceae bacterium]
MTFPAPRRWLLLGVGLLLLPACSQQMGESAGFKPLQPNSFFDDGRSSRPVVAGTVARGQLRTETALYEGKTATGEFVTDYPIPLSEKVLERGRERYNVFCSVCHGMTGHGDGRIVQRGFTRPPDYLPDASGKDKEQGRSRGYKIKDPTHPRYLTDVPVGYIYDVITRGYGAMPDHASQIPVRDRWAIVSYVRALQLSQSPELRQKMDAAEKGAKK